MLRTLTDSDVEFEIECAPDDIPFVGNCSAIDPETDEAAEKWISEELESGNPWAWCYVVVRARWQGFEGKAALGGCSYESEAAFCQPGGYFDDLRKEALDDLNDRIKRTSEILDTLAG